MHTASPPAPHSLVVYVHVHPNANMHVVPIRRSHGLTSDCNAAVGAARRIPHEAAHKVAFILRLGHIQLRCGTQLGCGTTNQVLLQHKGWWWW